MLARPITIHSFCYLTACLGLIVAPTVLAADDRRADTAAELFSRQVAPLLERSCVECHNSQLREGGLAVDSSAGLRAGGDSGPVVVAGRAADSALLAAVTPSADDPGERPAMPKGRPVLSTEEVASLRAWVDAGAAWPKNLTLRRQPPSDRPLWSLQPLASAPTPTDGAGERAWHSAGAIDGFIDAGLLDHDLTPNPSAERRDLIRRVTYDLTGLPPPADDVAAFVADLRPDAYERLVDRLLASPAFGERWARHWLDVVHYGESHGYDKDKPRDNAWPYRDYVIRSFNSDRPYSQFVTQQIAGDVTEPDNGEAIEAVGFLSAGPWDFIGHAEVPESKLDGKTARHLDRDDMVQNTFLTFQSLTVGCAQCHDHKFDPITQREYYGLQAVFSALDRADRKYYRDPKLQARFAALTTREQALVAEAAQASAAVRQAGGEQLVELEKQLAAARTDGSQKRYPREHGYHSAIERDADTMKWVQIDLGKPVEIVRIEWIACHDDFAGIGDGFGAPPRWRLELSSTADFVNDHRVVIDKTDSAQANPGIAPQSVSLAGQVARYVRFTATQLAVRKDDAILALAELRVFDAAGNNVALGQKVTSLDSIEAPPRWSRTNLVDDKYPTAGGAGQSAGQSGGDVAALEARRAELIARSVPRELLERERRGIDELAAARAELAAMPQPVVAYTATIHHGKGAFAGTGANGGRPRPVHLLVRGDIARPAAEVDPVGLGCLSELTPDLGSRSSSDAQRRAALARWLTDPGNPLTWRSIANRVWAHHFQRGIVSTPNDFGHMGSQPTHPQLLDHLAIDVRDHQSLKRLHRAIVLSSTYQRSCHADDHLLEIDPDNRWLARGPRRRLEAEAVRDSMLAVAGKLRREMGGPSYRDFVIERPEHSPHYEYALHDPRDPETMRRSIYRFIARSQTQPLLTSLDCADPSMQVDVRNQSTSATQALSLLNNAFTIMAAEEWAARMESQRVAHSDGSRLAFRNAVRQMFVEGLAREATEDEATVLGQLAAEHGLSAVARVLFNLNEFFYVD